MKLKLKTKKRIQGSISIFLVIILVPTMLLSGLLVDLSRFSMAKAMISSAGDLTMNAALADYDAILKEVYGLFAISQDDADLYKNLNEYFKTTLVSNGVVSEKDSKNYVDTLLGDLRQYLYVDKNSGEVNMNDVSNLFDMQISAEAAVKGAEGSTLANPTILKKQIVEYMKYRAPINIGLSFFSSLNSISKSGQQADVVQSKITAEEKTTDVQSAAKKVYSDLLQYDQRLYNTQNLVVGGDDTAVNDLNDTEGLSSYVNTEIYRDEKRKDYLGRLAADGTYWDYQTVNQYIVGFLLDDERQQIIFDTSTPDGESALEEEHWKKADDVKKDTLENALKDSADALEKAIDALGEYDDLKQLYLEQEQNGPPYADVAQLVRTNYTQAEGYYKTLFVVLNDEHKARTEELNESYGSYLQAASDFAATYADAAASLKLVIDAQKDEKDEEKSQELKDKITDLKKVFEDFLNERQDGDYKEVYASLENPDDDGKLSEENKLETPQAETNALDIITYYTNCFGKYASYRGTAKEQVGKITDDIAKEAQYIYEKATELEKILKTTNQDINKLLDEVDNYNQALDSWDKSNQTYESSANGSQSDEFSSNNSQEIDVNRKRYDKASIEKLQQYCQQQYMAIQPFVYYLNGNGWKYGSTKLYQITSADAAISAAKAQLSSYANLETPVDEASCANALKTMCPEAANKYTNTAAAQNSTKMYSVFKEKPLLSGEDEQVLDFAGYLKCTFKDEQTVSTTVTDDSGGSGNALELYKELKNSMSSGQTTDQQEESSGENGDKYGYTYHGQSIPSVGGHSGNNNKTVSADGENPSKSYKEQKDSSASLLSNIGNALENCRDDIFVMEYVMSNFSYNTMVQDAAYKNSGQKGLDFYASVDSDTYTKYKALTAAEKATYADGKTTDPYADTRPATLSGYPISSYNNQFYGAEVEYLFFGMDGADNNVTAAYSSIYALRFILNSIYAFTDTEIRNISRSAGLSVQAATVGVVPYQLVMVVMQLALSMSESLLDLEIMKTGAKVAVVPTKNTWILSPQGGKDFLQTIVKAKAKEVTGEAITAAAENVNDGLQKFVDGKAEEMNQNISDLTAGLNTTASAKADELLNQVYAQVEGTLLAELDKITYADYAAGAQVQEQVVQAFDAARQTKSEALQQMAGNGSQVSNAIQGLLNNYLDKLLNNLQEEALSKLNVYMEQNPAAGTASYVTSYVYEIESKMSETIRKEINTISKDVEAAAKSVVKSTTDTVKSLASQGTEEAKKQAIGAVNDLIDNSIDSLTDKIPDMSGLATQNQSFSGSSSTSHAISFGYSDYLRLFIFVGLASGNNDILIRTSNLIEQNINYPNKALSSEKAKSNSFFGELFRKISWFFGSKDSDGETTNNNKWQMEKAYTYVQIDADIDMDMFFMKTSLFNNWMNAGMAEIAADELDTTNTKSTYHYHSVMGY